MPTTTTRKSSASPRRTTRSGAAFSSSPAADDDDDDDDSNLAAAGRREPEEEEPTLMARTTGNSNRDDKDREQHESEDDDEEEAAAAAAKDEPEEDEEEVYHLDGVAYASYQAMVDAKRRRNQRNLEASGLLEAARSVRQAASQTTARGLRKRKSSSTAAAAPRTARRQSSRLRGVPSDGRFVDDERAGRFTVKQQRFDGDGSSGAAGSARDYNETEEEPQHYRNRIGDSGDAVTVRQAVEHAGPKWIRDDSAERAEQFVRNVLLRHQPAAAFNNSSSSSNNNKTSSRKKTSPRSVVAVASSASSSPETRSRAGSPSHRGSGAAAAATAASFDGGDRSFEALAVDGEDCVAKVCPDRIYSVAVHPGGSPDLVVAAGDKSGHVGLWHVNSSSNNNTNDGVHLFRPHTGAVNCLQWTGGSGGGAAANLFSASYDGTCRLLDVETGQFNELFATFDTDKLYRQRAGFGLDTGSRFWTQFGCLDRSSCSSLFLSTSVGTAMHVDLRTPRHITWHEELSEKKINTLSLHPNGYSLLSAGLDCTVNLWDVRQLGDSRKGGRHKAPAPVARYNGGRSVNSAFFSASGQYVVSTTMADKLDIFENFHLAAGNNGKNHAMKSAATVKPLHSIRHDNKTGRWLTTFQAIFHPAVDNVFAVGSMRKPRCLEFFDAGTGTCRRAVTGEALTAVASRLAFHPRTDRLVLVGGNSSGRVTIVQ